MIETRASPERYSRQLILPEIGAEGQARLHGSHVVIVGVGALGSFQVALLARAGVGRLTIIDRDFVERSNLQRQILFNDDDAARHLPKAVAAEHALRAVNPEIRIEGIVDDLNPGTAAALLAGADVIGDGTDNFETRYLINDWSVRERVPWVYAGVIGTGGLVLPVLPGETACLQCVFATPPAPGVLPTCETAGVLGPAVAVVAGQQTAEILKILVGPRERVTRALLRYDVWVAAWTSVATGGPRADCPACGNGDYAWLEGERGGRTARLCGRRAIQLLPGGGAGFPRLEALAERLGPEWEVTLSEHLLRARRDDRTVSVFRDGRAIIDGTSDEQEAKSLYARIIGV
jgi:adenylyltransferase/sulfurtransferase